MMLLGVPYIILCMSAIVPFIYMCMSAIMPLVFLQVLETSLCREVLLKFCIDSFMFLFFAEKSPLERSRSTSVTPIAFLAAVGLPAPRRLATAPTRPGPASLTPPLP